MHLRWIFLVAICLFPTLAFGGSLINPALTLEKGKSSLGWEYNYSRSKVKPERGPLFGKELTLSSNQLYFKGSYAPFTGNEVYLKLGIADLKLDKAFSNDNNLVDNIAFSSATGLKQSFEITRRVRFGGTVQFAYFNDYQDSLNTEEIEVQDMWGLDAALAMSYTFIEESVAQYAGVVASWQKFKFVKNWGTWYERDGLLGGLLGIEFFKEDFKGNIEVQIFKTVSGGVSISYVF